MHFNGTKSLLYIDEAQKIFHLAWRLLAAMTTVISLKVRKGGKDRESIQSSITPDPGYHLGK